ARQRRNLHALGPGSPLLHGVRTRDCEWVRRRVWACCPSIRTNRGVAIA
ncbi:unnamed protein product, partial [Ectocarpus sp. 13 AM-2016]